MYSTIKNSAYALILQDTAAQPDESSPLMKSAEESDSNSRIHECHNHEQHINLAYCCIMAELTKTFFT